MYRMSIWSPAPGRGEGRARGRRLAVGALLGGLALTGVLLVFRGWPLEAAVLVLPAIGGIVLQVVGRRPGRAAVAIAGLIVGTGILVTGLDVADGVANSRTTYEGQLESSALLGPRDPTDDQASAIRRMEAMGGAYPTRGEAEAVDTTPEDDAVVLWALSKLAPWALALAVFILLAPLARAADVREPFRADASRRLQRAGVLLLLGIPGLAVLRFMADEAGSAGRSYGLLISPHLTMPLTALLPGVLVLVLAGVFARGAELRELERGTI